MNKDHSVESNEKLTAVEWLVKELSQELDYIPIKQWDVIRDLVEQAKQMEKEQICNAWDDGDYAHFYSKETGKDFENGEEYYNETYNK